MAHFQRNYADWIEGFIKYTQYGEAPTRMYFWVGASVVAGALRRKVWIEQRYFRWYPGMYVVLVAPPGIVSKSTTASTGMNLLRKVPGIRFGPDIVTWQALATSFAASAEAFPYGDEFVTMSALTLESGEFGNLLNPTNKEMVDLLVSLWDAKTGTMEKKTKMSGDDTIQNPWINIIACTTPSWIGDNFPQYMIGGGFVSRCLFVYAEAKRQYVAYPGLVAPPLELEEMKLVQDLEHIANRLAGPYQLTEDAVRWGDSWYREHYLKHANGGGPIDDRLGGYIARKQTHIHKLAMILAAARRDDLVIEQDDLETANAAVSDLEQDMAVVFNSIGRSPESIQVDRFLKYLQNAKAIRADLAYRYIHSYFPSAKNYEEVLSGLIRAGFVKMEQRGQEMWLTVGGS